MDENKSKGMEALTSSSPKAKKEAPAPKKEEAPSKGVKKTFFTRGNLLTIGLALFFTFLMIFAGICISVPGAGESSIVSVKNPLALLRQSLGLPDISAHLAGQMINVLVAVFISLFTFAILVEYRRFALDGKKWYAKRNWLWYAPTLLICLACSFGFGLLIQAPYTAENLLNALTFVGESLLVTLIVYLLLAVLIGSLLLLIVNFVRFGKPLSSLGDTLEDEPQNDDIAAGFGDKDSNNGFASVASGLAGAGEGEANLTASDSGNMGARETVFPALTTIDKHYEGYAIESIPSDQISLPEIISRFRCFLAKKEKLYYSEDVLRFFLAGLSSSHLEILEGLSGTGKSSLPRSFAKFVSGVSVFIPVQATWRDKTSLLGYFNDFSKTYRETDFLMNLYEASYNPDRIYLFVLDEMNISRVEYYFADFLSVLEYPEDEWKLRVMTLPADFVPPAKLDKGLVSIPSSCYFIGTANQDDSTFSIADKVYDRAITIDFLDRSAPFVPEGDGEKIVLSSSALKKLFADAMNDPSFAFTSSDYKTFSSISDYIYDEFGVAFGNRILVQMEKMVPVFLACGGKKESILDFFLSRKVLSKLEGRFEDNVKPGLEHILEMIASSYGEGNFPLSEAMIKRMIKRL